MHFPDVKATDLKAKGNGFDPKTQRTGVADGFKEKREGEESVAAALSENQMEKDVLTVWDYYRDASGSQEVLSPSRKKKRLAIVRKIRERSPNSDPVICMAMAIDMVKHLSQKRPEKALLLQWDKIFSKWNSFVGFFQECNENGHVTEAGKLPAEYYAARAAGPAIGQRPSLLRATFYMHVALKLSADTVSVPFALMVT